MNNTAPNTLLNIIKRLNEEKERLHEELYEAELKLHGLGYTRNYLKEGFPWEELE